MASTYYLPIFIVFLIGLGSALIVPNEIPTLLSILYSNIPPLKLGTDSRVGFGFRLGPHADFQTLVEIGPQINTAKLASDGTAPNKRQSLTIKLPTTNLNKTESKPNVNSPKKSEPAKPYVQPAIVFKKVPGIDYR